MKADAIKMEIELIAGQIIAKYRPAKLILFGSAGRGDYDKVNDLDFLVIKEDVPLAGIDRMRELDRLIERNVAVDMIVYRPDEIADRLRLGDLRNRCIGNRSSWNTSRRCLSNQLFDLLPRKKIGQNKVHQRGQSDVG